MEAVPWEDPFQKESMYFPSFDCSLDPFRKDHGSVPAYLPDCAVTWATVEVLRTLCALTAFCLEHQEPVETAEGSVYSR